jgi:hypothetical protein
MLERLEQVNECTVDGISSYDALVELTCLTAL